MPEHETTAQPEPTEAAMPPLGGGPFYVGMRYLLKKKLSYLAMVGVAICVGVLMVVMSVMKGFENQFRAVVRGYLSDITIQPLTGKLYSFTDWREVMEDVLEVEHVKAAAPYIEGVGLLRAIETGHVIQIGFRGIDPELEKKVSRFGSEVSEEGFMFHGRLEDLNKVYIDKNEAEIPTCLVGSVMAGVDQGYLFKPGIRVVLVTATGAVRPRVKEHVAVGVFKTGRQDYDAKVVLLSLESAMRFVNSKGVSGLSVRLDDYANAPQTLAALRQKLGPAYGVQPWEQHEGAATFVKAIAMERFLMAVILCFISLLAGFCIFAILTMTVYEKRRDIGVLKAIGFTRARIATIFLLDGGAIGILGALVGIAGGLAFIYNINEIADFIESLTGWEPWPPDVYFFTEIPTDRGLLGPIIIAASAILSSLVFSVVPALKAARLDPVEALRFE